MGHTLRYSRSICTALRQLGTRYAFHWEDVQAQDLQDRVYDMGIRSSREEDLHSRTAVPSSRGYSQRRALLLSQLRYERAGGYNGFEHWHRSHYVVSTLFLLLQAVGKHTASRVWVGVLLVATHR